ncbi:hypothetical protein [Micromonospora zhanjiangensis]|uniref:Uncharacterized protein n=1 Tax=Micromonospora zhanjiangensis TaxID=1522057 RepID=A0ABV8KF58_9ACTN
MDRLDEPRRPASAARPTRPERRADDAPVLPERSADDTDHGWGERSDSNDDRLLADRPPHW